MFSIATLMPKTNAASPMAVFITVMYLSRITFLAIAPMRLPRITVKAFRRR
jgi:hypothetical protein